MVRSPTSIRTPATRRGGPLQETTGTMSFYDELKRRNVIRVAVAYAVASWLLLQVVDVLVPILGLPEWVGKLVVLILLIGLVPALIISWIYEMTPEGLKKDSEVNLDQSVAHHTSRKLDRITIALLVIVVGIVAVDRLVPETENQVEGTTPNSSLGAANTVTSDQPPEPHMPSDTADKRQSVAVIPFINMSDDDSNEYFSDGISEELLNVLVRIRSLRVPSRTSSFTYKDSDKKLSVIGQELDVEHILEGSVRKDGNRIRVTAQLIEAASDSHLWSETYTRDLDDVFAIQDEIAQAIVEALQLTLNVVDRKSLEWHSTSNVDAYNNYLLGRHFWNLRTAQSLKKAAEYLSAAVEIDPDFDQAWAALADTYVITPEYRAITPEYGSGGVQEFIPKARQAASKALSINPDSARALAAAGYIKASFDYDWVGAINDLERAVSLEPGYATAHQWYGEVLNHQRYLDDALFQLKLARQADPMSVVVRHVPGYFLLWALKLDEAEVHYKDTLELGPPMRWTLHNLDFLNTLRGDYDEARHYARALARLENFDPSADLARIDAVENPELQERALSLLAERQDMGDNVFGKALQYAVLGEYELALASLEAGFSAGDPYSASMNYIRLYDPLRDEPRFQAMLRAMNFIE